MGFCFDLADSRFALMVDEEVVRLAHRHVPGATEYLIGRYRPLVELKARHFYVVGADRDDVVQEGMIGLFEAIRDYREERARFRSFAELCVTRQILSAVKAGRRHKYELTNESLTLLTDAAPDVGQGGGVPVSSLLEAAVRTLSERERAVLEGFLDGRSYREMSDALGCSTKTIDNALQRARRKLGTVFRDPQSVS